jgi:hypothetical protein
VGEPAVRDGNRTNSSNEASTAITGDTDPSFEILPPKPKDNDTVNEYYHDKESGALFKIGETPMCVCKTYIKVIGLTRTLEDSE